MINLGLVRHILEVQNLRYGVRFRGTQANFKYAPARTNEFDQQSPPTPTLAASRIRFKGRNEFPDFREIGKARMLEARPGEQRGECLLDRGAEPVVHDQEQEVVLVARVHKDGAAGDLGALGDRLGGRLLEALAGEQLPGGAADPLARVFFLGGPRDLFLTDHAQ